MRDFAVLAVLLLAVCLSNVASAQGVLAPLPSGGYETNQRPVPVEKKTDRTEWRPNGWNAGSSRPPCPAMLLPPAVRQHAADNSNLT
jgi:hypothetical protein